VSPRDFDVGDFLAQPLTARIATAGPTVRPVWYLWEDGAFWILTGPWARLEARVREDPAVSLVVDVCDLTEDADHPVALDQRNGAQLDADALAVRTDHHDLGVMRLRRPGDVPGKGLPRPAGLLGRDDRGELPPANVADQPPGGRVQPANDTRGIDDVTRHADRLQRSFDVATELIEIRGHRPRF